MPKCFPQHRYIFFINHQTDDVFDANAVGLATRCPVSDVERSRLYYTSKDRMAASLDYEINLRAELEIMRLHEKFDILQIAKLHDKIDALTDRIVRMTQ